MERKPFLLRIDPLLAAELEAWAQDELRSVNGRGLDLRFADRVQANDFTVDDRFFITQLNGCPGARETRIKLVGEFHSADITIILIIHLVGKLPRGSFFASNHEITIGKDHQIQTRVLNPIPESFTVALNSSMLQLNHPQFGRSL